jgi:CheY-like chemotaxis protein
MKRIIVIDDDTTFGELTRQRLERAGYSVDVLNSPFGSLAQLRDKQYDLLILDVNMPGMKGSSLAELVQKTKGLEHSKIIFFSSMDPDSLQALASKHGVHGLSKSASAQTLTQTVGRLLGA